MASQSGLITHLIELRSRLLSMLVSVLLIFVCLSPFAQDIYHLLARPLLNALPDGASMIATDVVTKLPFVNSKKVGVMGLSGGGTMSLWMSLCDKRFKASEIICYSDLWEAFGMRDNNYCGMQVAPGLYQLVDF